METNQAVDSLTTDDLLDEGPEEFMDFEIPLPDKLKANQVRLESQDTIRMFRDTLVPEALDWKESDLESFKADDKYDYRELPNESNWFTRVRAWISNQLYRFFSWLFGGEKAGEYLALFFKSLPYIAVALLIYLIARFFLKVNKGGFGFEGKNKNLVNLSEEERIMEEEDIDALITEALANQDYRLALRYQFILCLKLLREGEWIDWQPQKTNHEYIQEVKDGELKSLMSRVVRIYDYAWYGDFPIDQGIYGQALGDYQKLQKHLQTR